MDDGAPSLEMGFAIETGGSFDALVQLAAVMGSTEAKILREAKNIEAATAGMVNLAGATASVTSFGNAATKAARDAARELSRAEKSGEALSRQLDRQASTFGKTREEIRAMKVETAALAAEQQGLTELAGRLRSQEAALYADEFAGQRRARLEAEAAAEAKQIAAALAGAAAEREARAVQDAAAAYRTFEAVARQRMATFREQQAAEVAVAKGAEADRLRTEAVAAAKLADEHARVTAMVRGSHDAQEADALAAERLRASTDPLYAATKRLNAEIAESTRLYHAGATAPAEYARQQQVLTERLGVATQQHNALAASAGRSGFALKAFAIQTPDIAQGLLTGQKPMTVFIQQGGQLVQVAMMAEGGIKGFAKELALLALAAAPVIAVLGTVAAVGYGAFKQFQAQVKDSGELTRYRDSLGLTHKEMLQLGDGVDKAGGKIEHLTGVTVTAGDVMSGIWKAVKDQAAQSSSGWGGFSDGATSAFRKILAVWSDVSAGITAGIYGTVNAAKVIWNNFATSVGDVFYQAVQFSIDAMNKLVKSGTDLLNGFIHAANKVPGVNVGDVAAPQIAAVANPYAGAASRDAATAASNAIRDGYRKAYADAKKADAEFWAQVGKNATQSAKDRMREQADALKQNRTPKVDHHAEQLAREGSAIEAQIRNLYKLADAYGVSGAAALIAEAQVKAESDAIKKRGDIEEFVNRQVRLAIAQRVSDAEKNAAATREQARIQTEVNGMVAAGTVPAGRANEIVQERIAELPLLAAIEAAQQRGLKTEAERATKALQDQRDAQADARAAAKGAFYTAADAVAGRQLEQQREELRLVGATDAERVRALATLKATQEVQAKGWDVTDAFAVKYIADQVAIATGAQAITDAQRAQNEQLAFAADRWDIIASKVQSAGQGMADAFGNAGRAIGDLASIYANFQASRARADEEHQKALKEANGNEGSIARANALFALRSSGAQIEAYGDMAAAAKGFFKEGSSGFKALEAAERIYRVTQLAMSLTAMVQDTFETGAHVANAAARATADGAAGVAKQSQLPFPLNIAAMAATAAALVAAGIAVIGGGGGSGHAAPVTNTGTGTVLGDSSAKSDSIRNALDALKDVDTLMLSSSREMAASLKSIDSQIGGLATVLVRAGDINASSGVTEGFKTNAIGSVLSKIPLIGGLLGSLFGSTTTVTGSGLYGGAQSIGAILSGGFNASTYSDIQKKSKLFGITTSTKNSTQYAAADSTLTSQFTLILKSFDDAILAAAGPLGEATGAVQARLNGFIVDIGKIDLKGLTGQEIQDKLEAVFGAAADHMADAAFPGITRFQKVGEGAFETLVRVSSTLEAVGSSLDLLGSGARQLGIDAKLGIADQFDSVSALTSAADAYFQAFYTKEEQAAARTAQFTKVFDSLGLSMPSSLAGFRQLVEAQDLTTAAGQSVYATLLQLAPAFADLQSSMAGAKSAADIASERQDLQRQLLELQGDTAAIRALDLAKLDASNRGLQEQVWAVQDAQKAADAAQQLRDAWTSVGDGIMDEVKRIRGLTDTGGGTFAALQGQFNAATTAARAGDQDAAKSLPGLSQALLTAAATAASSRQELDRVQAQTASSLEATKAAIDAITAAPTAAASTAALLAAASNTQAASSPPAAAHDAASSIADLRSELAATRADLSVALTQIVTNTGKVARKLDDVTSQSGGDAISTIAA